MAEAKIDWGEKRTSKRIEVSLPLLVRGLDKYGVPFEDSSASYNVSREGLSFSTTRELEKGQQVELVIPRRPFGRETASQTDFETRGEVVRVTPKGEGRWEIGLHFIGPRFRTYIPERT